MKYSLMARFEAMNYTMAEGTDIETAMSGKQFFVYELYNGQSKRQSYTYQKGTSMTFQSIRGKVITFALSLSLTSSGAGIQKFSTTMTGGTGSTYSNITITESAKTAVSVPEYRPSRPDTMEFIFTPTAGIAEIALLCDGRTVQTQSISQSEYGTEVSMCFDTSWFSVLPVGQHEFHLEISKVSSGYKANNSSVRRYYITVYDFRSIGLTYKNGNVYIESDDIGQLELAWKSGSTTSTRTFYSNVGTGIPSSYSIGSADWVSAEAYGRVEFYSDSANFPSVWYEDYIQESFYTGAPSAPTISSLSNTNMTMKLSNTTAGATYVVYRDGVEWFRTAEVEFLIDEQETGTHKYQVQAIRDNLSSPLSLPISKNFSRLQPPICFAYESDGEYYIKSSNYWSVSQYMTAYINGEPKSILPINGITETNITKFLQTGRNYIDVYVATTSKTIYLPSETVRVEVIKSGEGWVAEINGTEYGVQYPLSITRTADETLDVGSIILDINDTKSIKTPFDAFVNVTLKNFADDGTERLRMEFLVEKDDVSESQMGDEIWSLHELTLVEQTRSLQARIMPDIAVTQPLSLASQIGSEAIGDPFGNSTDIEGRRWFIRSESTSSDMGLIWNASYYWAVFRVGAYDVVSNIQSSIPTGFEANLPDLNCDGIEVCKYKIDQWVVGLIKSHKKEEIVVHHPTKTVLIRKRSGGESKWTRAQALNYIKTDRSAFCSVQSTDEDYGKLTYKFDEVAQYDIYLYVEPLHDGRLVGDGSTEPAKDLTESPNLVGMRSDGANPTASDEFLYCFTTSTAESSTSDSGYTVGKALDKVLGAVKPLEVVARLGTAKLPYDVECTHSGDLCYEGSWSGGKTLYEILKDIGTQFRGIPRLEGKIVKFDIIGETLNGNPLWEDDGSLIKESSDMDTQATALISQAKNIVSEDMWETYPSESGWVSCRSSDPNDAYCTRSNSVIKLPRKIFQVKAIYVKDLSTGGQYSIFSGYCRESTLWNLLTDDQDGKGVCLKFTRGDDKIENIGALVNEDTYELWGLQPDEYVIQNILHSITGRDLRSFDPQNLVYRVVYRPYTDQVVKCEQANGAESVPSQLAFNQDVSVATDSRLGAVMQDKVSRLGNNAIQKMCRTDIDSVPKVGQHISKNGSDYYLTKVNYTIERTYVESTMEFSKDKNNIDVSVGLPSEYRQYEIEADDYVERQVSIDCYAIASDAQMTADSGMKATQKIIIDALKGSQHARPMDFYITAKRHDAVSKLSNVLAPLRYTSYDGVSTECTGFALHADYHSIGTQVALHAKALDNYSMGVRADELEESVQSRNSGRYIQKDCRYVDDLGKTPYIGVALGTFKSDRILAVKDLKSIPRTLPMAKYTASPEDYMTDVVTNGDYHIQKDNREALSFQWSLHFVSGSDLIEVRSGIASNLFKKEGITQSVHCYKATGVIADSLTAKQMEQEIAFTVTETTSGVKVSTAEKEWVLCISDTKMRPAIISKGSKDAYISVKKSWKGE